MCAANAEIAVHADEELAYVSSLLHDLQLEHPTSGRCFAVLGGERAERFALARGVDLGARGRDRRGDRGGTSHQGRPRTSPSWPGSFPPGRSSAWRCSSSPAVVSFGVTYRAERKV